MAAIHRASPRFLKAGEDNRMLISSRCIVWGGVLSGNTGNASLSVYNANYTVVNATSAVNRICLFAERGKTAILPSVPLEYASGVSISCNGTGARATLFVSTVR
ncbi:MAG: hypothetical protein HN341_14470 [Verrucomicrobia bacterium]|jgi:hypothetical protein|nr:hypothetical protein [Verrucomicrobiota bacterium]